MKQLTCEMCGSTEVMKQDGVFVCQTCGCKYSVEEAKKMMVEGTVDVQGTVKVDNSAFVEKYLVNARRAKQKEDWEETEKYYNMVEQNDPTNIEAIFYSSYAKAKQSLLEPDDFYKRQATFKVLQNCVSIIDDNYLIEKEDEEKVIIEGISNDILAIVSSNWVIAKNENPSKNLYTKGLFENLLKEWITSLKNIIAKYEQQDKAKVEYIFYLIIKLCEFTIDKPLFGTLNFENDCKADIVAMHEEIKKIHPDHEVPTIETNSGGCYVATAVYGSYDCPQVWTLRRFRDYTLAKTWYGRAFIHIYYAISPTIVRYFGHTEWFKKMWKGKLDRMVANLNAEGVENTPYEDRNW